MVNDTLQERCRFREGSLGAYPPQSPALTMVTRCRAPLLNSLGGRWGGWWESVFEEVLACVRRRTRYTWIGDRSVYASAFCGFEAAAPRPKLATRCLSICLIAPVSSGFWFINPENAYARLELIRRPRSTVAYTITHRKIFPSILVARPCS